MEFTYGGDGLDPVFMEIKDKPVDIPRQFMHVKAKHPCRDEDTVKGEDVLAIGKKILNSDEFIESRVDFKTEAM